MGEATVPVLVVDDNVAFLHVTCAILEEISPTFVVHTAQTASEALAFVDHQPPFGNAPRPAFIILDFCLPDMNAPALLDQLRARSPLRAIPVLVLSQANWEEDETKTRAAGATAFLLKPSRVQPLRDAIADFWKEHVDGSNDLTSGR